MLELCYLGLQVSVAETREPPDGVGCAGSHGEAVVNRSGTRSAQQAPRWSVCNGNPPDISHIRSSASLNGFHHILDAFVLDGDSGTKVVNMFCGFCRSCWTVVVGDESRLVARIETEAQEESGRSQGKEEQGVVFFLRWVAAVQNAAYVRARVQRVTTSLKNQP